MSTHITLEWGRFDEVIQALHRYDLGRNARRAAEAKALKNAEGAYYCACYVLHDLDPSTWAARRIA